MDPGDSGPERRSGLPPSFHLRRQRGTCRRTTRRPPGNRDAIQGDFRRERHQFCQGAGPVEHGGDARRPPGRLHQPHLAGQRDSHLFFPEETTKGSKSGIWIRLMGPVVSICRKSARIRRSVPMPSGWSGRRKRPTNAKPPVSTRTGLPNCRRRRHTCTPAFPAGNFVDSTGSWAAACRTWAA